MPLIVFVVALFLVVVVWTFRGYRRHRPVARARRETRHEDALALPPGAGYLGGISRVLQAESAALLGRYELALDLIGQARRNRGVRAQLAAADGPNLHEIIGLIGVGRYREVLDLTDLSVLEPSVRHARAQAAIELGEDAIAEAALGTPEPGSLAEAGRLRIAGDLRIRRAKIEDGRALVHEAERLFASLEDPWVEIDRAYCHTHLAEAALAAGDTTESTAAIERAIELAAVRPDNAPGLLAIRCVAARVAAADGRHEEATVHLELARAASVACGEPPTTRAAVARAAGDVAVAAGSRADAMTQYGEAVELLSAMGASPESLIVEGSLRSLEGESDDG